MATVQDVAAFILNELGETTAMKLQKLVYYSQAWSLVWDDQPLFDDPIQAWANGPVVPTLYAAHRGRFRLAAGDITGNPSQLSAAQIDTIKSVLKFYGDKSAQWLSDLTHRELPWRDGRDGLPDGERGSKEITQASMAEYYGSL